MMKKYFNLFLLFLVITFGALAQAPEGYYDQAEDLTGEQLKKELHRIVRNHRVRTYSEFRDVILPDLDEDPNNAENIILFYKNSSIPKEDFANGNDGWNREHTWPSSHGFSNDADTAYTDVHNLRPSDASVNASKSNKDFNDVEHIEENEEGEAPETYTTDDFWEPRDEIKGDVARILFYMDIRYESERLNLQLKDRISFSSDPELGVLYTLIKWHELDPVDDAERERHEGAFGYQENRNPFIDHPEWVASIWGSASNPTLIDNRLNFSRDFGKIELGSSQDQTYVLNAYNLVDDVSVEVTEPFYVSVDQATWTDSIGFANDDSGEQIFNVYLRYVPSADGEETSAIVSNYTNGDTLDFEIFGQEGGNPIITIAKARTKNLGESVYITGVVIDRGNNSSNNKVIYDGTAGIVLRSFDSGNESENLTYGDSVTVKGTLGDYNNLLQISESPITITLEGQDKSVPDPLELTISEIGEEHESELVVVRNVSFVSSGVFAGGGSSGNFFIRDESGNIVFRIGSDSHPLVGTAIPDGDLDITGFVGQFGTDYQISPRDLNDMIILETEEPLSVSGVFNNTYIYPNPVGDFLKLKGLSDNSIRISVVDLNGKEILKGRSIDENGTNVTSLIGGNLYVLILRDEYGNRSVESFIKK